MKRLSINAKILTLVFLTFLFTPSAKAQTKDHKKKPTPTIEKWIWPDKLDALANASENHKIVYEDSNVRVLQVICPPGNEEPVHTHRYKSTMWFTQSAHFMYYTYVTDANNQLVKKDSVEVNGFPAEALNKGQMVDREAPHSIKNISTNTLIAYRIEYKKDFKE